MKRTPPLGDYRNPPKIPFEDLEVATAEQLMEAWIWGVMHGPWFGQYEDHAKNPPTVPDPIYRSTTPLNGQPSERNGWVRASEILNPSAMAGITGYLAARGLRVADEIQAAWDETNRRSDLKEQILQEVRAEFNRTDENASEPGHPTYEDYVSDIARRLNATVEPEMA